MYLPTFAPQKPANLWRSLYFKIITSELTCVSGMIQTGAASPAGWSRSGSAGLAAQELGLAGPRFTRFYPSAAKSFFISSVAEGIWGYVALGVRDRMEFCPKPLQPLEGERLYRTSSRALVCIAGLSLSLSCLFLTVLQQCAGREILASLCLVTEKPHSRRRSLQTDRWGAS